MTSTQIFPNQKLTLDPLITKDSSKLSAQKKKEEAELKELLMAPLPETQEERLKRIETLFSSFDTNSSGKIDRQSIRDRFSKASDLPSGLTYANELFEVVDSSKDGVIDFQEFKNFVLAKETKLWHLFNRIDQSKDKLLQPNEVLKGLKDAGNSQFIFKKFNNLIANFYLICLQV
jgi:solute carrier family 25 phosphate transporter 23/24/25/41